MSGAKVLTKRQFRGLVLGILVILLVTFSSCVSSNKPLSSQKETIPVILDTDICDDIDDTWALILLLQSPEFDIKLVTSAVGNTAQKAKT
ncbi:MAG: hypothetical protein ACYS9Y_13165, partial [Planctomycetota bacterium]